MTFFQAAVLGLVQGLSEFLPISSSAHLYLVRWFSGWEDPGLAFDVALHWGTLIGVVIYFRRDIGTLISGFFSSLRGKREFSDRLPWYVLAGTIPAAAIGFLFEKKAEAAFRSPWIIAAALFVVGILIYIADQTKKERKDLNQLILSHALLIGSCQGLAAIIPGVSRSGITIAVALFFGYSRTASVTFSFLLSIPIIFGAGVLKFDTLLHGWNDPILLTAMITAALSGLAAIMFLMHFVKAKSFTPFVIYRIALAAVIVGVLMFHGPH